MGIQRFDRVDKLGISKSKPVIPGGGMLYGWLAKEVVQASRPTGPCVSAALSAYLFSKLSLNDI